jgi:hypothetical protein
VRNCIVPHAVQARDVMSEAHRAGGSGVSASVNRMVVPFPKMRLENLPVGAGGDGDRAGEGGKAVGVIEVASVVTPRGVASDTEVDAVGGET